MVELLQISCVMAFLWPKLETHLGQGRSLDEVQKMWQLGHLGCQKVRVLNFDIFSNLTCSFTKNHVLLGISKIGLRMQWNLNSAVQNPAYRTSGNFWDVGSKASQFPHI
jgi:hypothetical protein